ncbi:MAG: hypothetical protein AAB522_01475 [Patescibacteria group bacterium]
MIRFILALFASLALFVPAFSIAHENEEGVTQLRKEEIKTLRADISQKRETLKSEAMEKRDALNTDIKQKREALKMESKNLSKEQLMEKREMFREEVKTKREDLRETIKEKREAFKEEAKERIEALKKKLSEERAKRIEAFFGTMVRKFEAAISRLRKLGDRIDSRLDKFEDAGKDVATFKTSLENARTAIEAAEDALDKAKEEFKALSQSENPKEYFKKVKDIVATVAQKVKNAHKALVDVINSIKGLSDTSS